MIFFEILMPNYCFRAGNSHGHIDAFLFVAAASFYFYNFACFLKPISRPKKLFFIHFFLCIFSKLILVKFPLFRVKTIFLERIFFHCFNLKTEKLKFYCNVEAFIFCKKIRKGNNLSYSNIANS